jgi:energy coupling factor transporter S component ThiW
MVIRVKTKLLAYIAVFGALGAALGWISIPVGPTKVFPLQHTINAIAGVLIGPWAAVSSLIAATARFSTGLGTVYAFPGSPFGALVVAIIYKIIKRDFSALFEGFGTIFIGGTLSALLIAPFLTEGSAPSLWFFWTAFGASCIPGSILGYIILKILRRSQVDVGISRP